MLDKNGKTIGRSRFKIITKSTFKRKVAERHAEDNIQQVGAIVQKWK